MAESSYSLSLISLLKGIVYSDQKEVWENLLTYEADVQQYFKQINLELYLDKAEGYGFLRQREFEPEDEAAKLPKLAERRQLNFQVSLLCLVLRKYLLEHDAEGGTVRSIISEQEIINRAKVFLPLADDEAKQQDKIVSSIKKVIEIGFLRKLAGAESNYEIHRIIKGFINAEVIEDMLTELKKYSEDKAQVKSI